MVRARRSFLLFALVMIALPLGGCARFRGKPREPQPPTFVHVINSNYLDATILLVQRNQRVRLGIARSNDTTTFEIPSQYIFGPTPVAFIVDPIGGRAQGPTEEIVVSPGDELDLRLETGRMILVYHGD